MKILISGASGLIGSALVPFLTTGGHQVLRLVRRAARSEDEVSWFPGDQTIERERLEGLDAVIHLAGESIAGQRWDAAFKQRVLSSRIQGTHLLAEALCQLARPPKVLVSASAIGYYGDRGDEAVDESALPGRGFLSEVCQRWEAEARAVERCGVRLVMPRLGVVLSGRGGALGPMLLPFRFGLGGVVGSGEQVLSWIDLDDAVRAIWHCVHTSSLSGPVNLSAPNPVSNREFTRVLAKVLGRPALLGVPAIALKLALGKEMARELVLASTRALPRKLIDTGFIFEFGQLEPALRHSLGKTSHSA